MGRNESESLPFEFSGLPSWSVLQCLIHIFGSTLINSFGHRLDSSWTSGQWSNIVGKLWEGAMDWLTNRQPEKSGTESAKIGQEAGELLLKGDRLIGSVGPIRKGTRHSRVCRVTLYNARRRIIDYQKICGLMWLQRPDIVVLLFGQLELDWSINIFSQAKRRISARHLFSKYCMNQMGIVWLGPVGSGYATTTLFQNCTVLKSIEKLEASLSFSLPSTVSRISLEFTTARWSARPIPCFYPNPIRPSNPTLAGYVLSPAPV